MPSEVKTLAWHSSIYAISNILRKAVGFIMIPIYTRYLMPSDYGVIELLDLTLTILIMFVGMRMGGVLIRFYHKYETIDEKNEVVSSAYLLTFFLGLIVFILLEFFSSQVTILLTGDIKYEFYFQLIFLCLAFRLLSLVPESYLLATKKSFIYSSISLGVLVVSFSLNILFVVFMEMGVYGIVLSMVITKFLNGVVLFALTLKSIPLKFCWKKTKEMILFGLPLIPAGFSIFLMHFSDRFFIQKYCSLDELGIYSLGYKFGMIISLLISRPFFNTWDTQRYEVINKFKNPELIIGRIFTYYFLLMVFSSTVISTLINEAIIILAAEEYHGASFFVPIILFGYVFFGIQNFFTLGPMLNLKTKYLAYIQTFMMIVNICLNVVLIRQFGLIGASVSTLLSFLGLAAITAFVSQKLYPVKLEYTRLLIIIGIAFSTIFVSNLVYMDIVMSIFVKTILLCFFPLILYLIGFFTVEEIEKIKSFIFTTYKKFPLLTFKIK